MTFTPELADVLRAAIGDSLEDLHTALPGVVLAYDASKQRARVQPAIKRRTVAGASVTMPILEDVPVWFPAGGNFSLTYPVAAGDPCLIVFGERSMEVWKRDGGVVDPGDTRRHHLSDAWVMVGGRPLSKAIPGVSATDFNLVLGSSKVKIEAGGDVTMQTSGGMMKVTAAGKFVINGVKDVMQLLIDFATKVSTAQVLTALGPQPIMPPESTDIAQIAADLSSVKG